MLKPVIPRDSLFLSRDTRRERWAVPYHFESLNARIENLLINQRDALQGKVVLDLGSHMGTFSYAALKLGADFVYCIDTEERLLRQGEELFEYYQVPKARYRFEREEVVPFLESQSGNRFDTLFCFGLLYYIPEPFQLLQLMAKVARETILLDTFTAAYAAVQGKDSETIQRVLDDSVLNLPMMLVVATQAQKTGYRLPKSFTLDGNALSLTSYPTRHLLETWFEGLNLRYKKLSWGQYAHPSKQWRDFLSATQKKESHWADIYSSDLRVSYRLDI